MLTPSRDEAWGSRPEGAHNASGKPPAKSNGRIMRINDIAPNFTTDSTTGKITLHDWIGESYAVLFSHPKDFTPVCTTELSAVARLAPECHHRSDWAPDPP